MDNGISFGPFSSDSSVIGISFRVKYTDDNKLRWVATVFPSKGNEAKFHEIVSVLLSRDDGMSSDYYKNRISFLLKDKDGFVLDTIKIMTPALDRGQYLKKDDKLSVEYTGSQKSTKELALRIAECDVDPDFKPDLDKLISISK